MSELPPTLATMIDGFQLSLTAAKKAAKTRDIYLDATRRHARWLAAQGVTDWEAVTRHHIRGYLAWLQEGAVCWCGKSKEHPELQCPKGKPASPGYVSNQYRSIQQFWKWLSSDEDLPNPMTKIEAPNPESGKVVPLVDFDQLAAQIKACERGKDFVSRRDTALMRMFASTGCRLEEVTALQTDHINLAMFEAIVTGKGGWQRIVRFDPKCAEALSRYLRTRAKHKLAATPHLWLSTKNCAMTANGIRQMFERRGLGHPHMFRHTYSHRWLDAGGAEGDLMEQMGWKSPQMLRRYGKSARSARARRAYDRVDVMGGI